MKKKLQIKDISNLTGLDRETLRFYEQKGLLPKPTRSTTGYRLFDEEVVERLQFINQAQQVGFSLKEISNFLALGTSKTVTKDKLKEIADSKISDIDKKIDSLNQMRSALASLSARASDLTKKSKCPILSQLKNLDL